MLSWNRLIVGVVSARFARNLATETRTAAATIPNTTFAAPHAKNVSSRSHSGYGDVMGGTKKDDFGSTLQSMTTRDCIERVCQLQNSKVFQLRNARRRDARRRRS